MPSIPRAHPAARQTWLVLLIALAGWIALNAGIVLLAHGFLPFDRPAVARMPFALQVGMPSLALIEQVLLMGVVAWLTRGRAVAPQLDALPAGRALHAETWGLIAWAMAAQAGGWIVGPLFGFRPFSFHLAGTLFGCSVPPSPAEALVWAGYNFAAFVVVPLAWFARRYTWAALWLTFRKGDWLVIGVVLVIESLVQIAANPAALTTPAAIWLKAGPITLMLYGVGTVLPTMVTVYAILVPRYWKLTGSVAAATILGGLTYAAMHLVEGWSVFNTPTNAALSLLFVFANYTGPGMFKSYATLRTGNAWVHAIGYHAVAPHVLFDTPLIARIFAIR